MARRIALIEGERVTHVPAQVEDSSLRVAAGDVRRAFGWELKAQGLCKADVCIPLRDRSGFEDAGGIELAALAGVLDRPLALDLDEGVAVLGQSAAVRTARLRSLEAPDFTLPDWKGAPHSLSQYRGKKVLLIAYASW